MNIVPLAQRLELADRIAQRHGDEWRHLYIDWDEATALREFKSEREDGSLPFTFIALDGPAFAGSISIVRNDLPGWEKYNPWIASFLVLEEARGKGVGGRLLAEAEAWLARQGYQTAFLFTEHAQGYFARHGWQTIAQTMANTHPVQVMQKTF